MTSNRHKENDILIQPRLINAKDFKCIDWLQEHLCLLVISTSGDGEYNKQ